MKRITVSILSIMTLFAAAISGFGFTASAQKITNVRQETTVSTQTTYERTDDDPFAGNNKPAEDKKTPTFYYILGTVAGLVIIFAVIGFITAKNKK